MAFIIIFTIVVILAAGVRKHLSSPSGDVSWKTNIAISLGSIAAMFLLSSIWSYHESGKFHDEDIQNLTASIKEKLSVDGNQVTDVQIITVDDTHLKGIATIYNATLGQSITTICKAEMGTNNQYIWQCGGALS